MAEDQFFERTIQTEVGAPSLVETTAQKDEEEAKQQTWYNTLGIGGDENTETLADGVKDSFISGGNWGYNIYQDIARMYDNVPDDNFSGKKFLEDNAERLEIKDEYRPAYARTSSLGEAMDLHRDIKLREEARTRLNRMGITGQIAAGAIAGFADIDTLASGGFALVGKTGLMATRMGRILSGTAAGTSSAALGAAASPEDDWADVAVAAFLSAGVATGSVALSGKINQSLDDSLEAANQSVLKRDAAKAEGPLPEQSSSRFYKEEPEPVEPKEGAPKVEEPEPITTPDSASQLGSSTGAVQVKTDKIAVTLQSASAEEVQAFARKTVVDNDIEERFKGEYAPALNGNAVQSGTAKAVRKVTDTINKLGLAVDYDRFMTADSASAKALAFLGLRDPQSRIANNANAASYHQTFSHELEGPMFSTYMSERKAYTDRLGLNKFGGLWTPQKRRAAQREFDQRVYIEQENMRLDGKYSDDIPDEVRIVAEQMDDTFLREHRIAVGDGVTTTVRGWDEFDPYKGYAPRPLATDRIYGDIRKSKREFNEGKAPREYTEKDFEDMYAGYYGDPRTGLTKAEARNVAKMVMSHARDGDQGLHVDLSSLYNRSSPDAFYAMAQNAGISRAEAGALAKRIERFSEWRSQQGQTKNRIDGDIRYVHPNGLRILDYVNTDIERTIPSRLRRTAGLAALARGVGIRSPEDMQAWKQAILNEQAKNAESRVKLEGVRDVGAVLNDQINKPNVLTSEDIDGLFAQFTGGAVKGDTMAGWVMRGKRWSSMSALGSTGMWQVAETNNLVGAAGWAEMVKQLPAAVKSQLTNPRSELLQELAPLGKFIPEERMTSPYYVGDLNESLHAQSEALYWVDKVGAKGTNLQGMLSGMFKIREIQHNLSTFIATDKLFRSVAGKEGGFSETRLLQMGADPEFIADLKTIHNMKRADGSPMITWDGDNVKRLNLDEWKNGDLEYRFLNTINTFTDQQVQRAIAGETNSLFAGNGVTSLFTQFLSFPMMAINKQMARQAYAGDTEALMTAMYGFLFGGMIGMSKATMSGKFEELDLETFAKSGFQNGNLTGWLPNFADPLLGLMGLEDYRFNPHGSILREPPAVSLINSIAKSPSSAAKLVFGDTSAKNINNLRIIPVLGNHPLWIAMLSALKD